MREASSPRAPAPLLELRSQAAKTTQVSESAARKKRIGWAQGRARRARTRGAAGGGGHGRAARGSWRRPRAPLAFGFGWRSRQQTASVDVSRVRRDGEMDETRERGSCLPEDGKLMYL